VDLKQLRALLTIADTGSVTRAAEVLQIVQPAVSRQLRLLEEDIGAELFVRGRNRMELTEAGRTLVEYARRAMHHLDRARAEISPSAGEVTGIVTFGVVPSMVQLVVSPLMSRVAERYPGIKLRFSSGNYADLLQPWVEAGEVELAILSDHKASPAIQVEPLVEELLWVVGLPGTGLRPEAPVPFSLLGAQPVILPSSFQGFRLQVEHACTLEGVHLSVVAETSSMHVQRHLVLGGHGLTVLPVMAVADDLAQGRLAAAPLTAPEVKRRIYLALPANRRIPRSVRCVAAEIVGILREVVLRGGWPSAQWLGPA
jgi:LysR family nitrogen assimilation transcriptional regulator